MVAIALDGPAAADVSTGVPFFDHMLEQVARHGGLALTVRAKGDIEVDAHHTIEDVGIAFGRALAEALGDRRGITRYADRTLPMDEVLATAAIDLGGRAHLVYRGETGRGFVGSFDAALVREFFRAVVDHSRMNLHLVVHAGGNAHHAVEACFKAFARALADAAALDPRAGGEAPSTKGMLEPA